MLPGLFQAHQLRSNSTNFDILIFTKLSNLHICFTNRKSKDDVQENAEPAKDFPPIVIPVFAKEDMNERLIPIGSAPPARGNRTGRFFGVTTGASGNNLQV